MVAALAFFGLLASIPKELWIGMLVLGLIWIGYTRFARGKNEPYIDTEIGERSRSLTITQVSTPARFDPQTSEYQSVSAQHRVDLDEPVSVSQAPTAKTTPSFRVPSAPKGFGPGVWIPRGQAIDVAGVSIPDGMVYVGTLLKTPGGSNDPCLIDPSKQVAQHGDYTERQMGYWPSYSDITSVARRAYLNWLAGGKSDPEVDIGYVFLFFYGLERRAIFDATEDPAVQSDWPSIADEIRRLLDIYGEKSGSFKNYGGELLNWLALATHPSKLYEKPVPALPKTHELPLYIRLALGQAAVDGVPVPTHIALAWAKLDPNNKLRAAATRCEKQFDALFESHYAKASGAGMVIPKNRTKLKFVYQAASAGFRGANEIKLTFGETPDVTVLSAPIKMLREIVDAATKELDAYSRFVGKNPDARDNLEGLLLLPASHWPDSAQKTILNLKARIGSDFILMPFQELLTNLGAKSAFTKAQTQALTQALASMNIGVEPDVMGGAKVPKPDDPVVLFILPMLEETAHLTAPTYQAALLTLQLASSVAIADGEFSDREMQHLRSQVQSWVHLMPNHQLRLLAHLRLLMAAPVPLASLKKKLETLESSAKESIAAFMATLAQADGTVSTAEIKILEKAYKALGLDAKKVFSDIHAVAAESFPTMTDAGAKIGQNGFKLDPARIATLQHDTAKVSALLAIIFTEEETMPATPPDSDLELEAGPEQAEAPVGLLGLDEPHSTLARMLLSRPQWSREELLDVAADLDLMLDGALERINDASFDMHNIPFTEGDDPIDVNAEVREKIEA